MRFIRFVVLTALAAFALALGPLARAAAPIENVYVTPAKGQTYAAVVTGLTPASAATDVLTITGSATMTVKVRYVACTGTSTAAGSLNVTLLKRSAADTGGTSTAATAVPLDSASAAATAAVAAYTANPTVGAAVGSIATGLLLTVPAASADPNGVVFDFTRMSAVQEPVLRGTSQVLALSAGGGTFTAGASLTCEAVWTEQ